jgi:hypothetical protein
MMLDSKFAQAVRLDPAHCYPFHLCASHDPTKSHIEIGEFDDGMTVILHTSPCALDFSGSLPDKTWPSCNFKPSTCTSTFITGSNDAAPSKRTPSVRMQILDTHEVLEGFHPMGTFFALEYGDIDMKFKTMKVVGFVVEYDTSEETTSEETTSEETTSEETLGTKRMNKSVEEDEEVKTITALYGRDDDAKEDKPKRKKSKLNVVKVDGKIMKPQESMELAYKWCQKTGNDYVKIVFDSGGVRRFKVLNDGKWVMKRNCCDLLDYVQLRSGRNFYSEMENGVQSVQSDSETFLF